MTASDTRTVPTLVLLFWSHPKRSIAPLRRGNLLTHPARSDDVRFLSLLPPMHTITHKQAMATQLSIGFCYSWSIMNDPLTRMIGVVAPASGDWALQ